MGDDLLMTFNAGSSTLKIGIFAIRDGSACRIGKAVLDYRDEPFTLQISAGAVHHSVPLSAPATEDPDDVLGEALAVLADHYPTDRLKAIGHRVVHGGDVFAGPVLIDDAVLASISGLTALAPLHQPRALRIVRAVRRIYTAPRQTASFDTAFHRTQSELVRRFALPRALHDAGIKRYGFHGLSYASIAKQMKRSRPELAQGRVVVAHLGSGASLCALEGGESRDTSMGFSTLDGIPMATRCGALDPGVLLHLLQERQTTPKEIENLLYHQSGLLGVSGISADSRVLIGSGKAEAREALDLFAFRIAGEAARLASTLGGLDGFVFTAGIGEHQPEIRAAICRRLRWLGLELDDEANEGQQERISTLQSPVAALVMSTDEEQTLADDALSMLL